MVFTVISIAPGLSPKKHRRAVECGPEFVEAEYDYPTLLGQTGWTIIDREDLTPDYAASYRRKLEAHEEHKKAVETLIGTSEFAERQTDWRSEVAAIDDGLLRRELLVAVAAP
jgi:hypothetical protein